MRCRQSRAANDVADKSATYEGLEAAFRSGAFHPLYFFYGEEQHPIQELERLLVSRALEPHERDFNLDVIHGPDADVRQVVAMCRSYPMMARRRVVVVRNFEEMPEAELFAGYAEQPNDQAVVLVWCAARPNLNAGLYKTLKAKAVWAEFKPLYARHMNGWIQKRAHAKGYEMDGRAVQMLAEYVGAGMRQADLELDKLAAFVGDRTVITPDDVIYASGQTREFNVFELQKVVGERRYDAAVRISEHLMQQSSNARSEAIAIVAVLASYYTKLWKLLALEGRAASDDEKARRIGVPPYFLKEYAAAARLHDRPAVESAFAALLAADYELKGGSNRSERLVVTLLLNRLLRASRQAPASFA